MLSNILFYLLFLSVSYSYIRVPYQQLYDGHKTHQVATGKKGLEEKSFSRLALLEEAVKFLLILNAKLHTRNLDLELQKQRQNMKLLELQNQLAMVDARYKCMNESYMAQCINDSPLIGDRNEKPTETNIPMRVSHESRQEISEILGRASYQSINYEKSVPVAGSILSAAVGQSRSREVSATTEPPLSASLSPDTQDKGEKDVFCAEGTYSSIGEPELESVFPNSAPLSPLPLPLSLLTPPPSVSPPEDLGPGPQQYRSYQPLRYASALQTIVSAPILSSLLSDSPSPYPYSFRSWARSDYDVNDAKSTGTQIMPTINVPRSTNDSAINHEGVRRRSAVEAWEAFHAAADAADFYGAYKASLTSDFEGFGGQEQVQLTSGQLHAKMGEVRDGTYTAPPPPWSVIITRMRRTASSADGGRAMALDGPILIEWAQPILRLLINILDHVKLLFVRVFINRKGKLSASSVI